MTTRREVWGMGLAAILAGLWAVDAAEIRVTTEYVYPTEYSVQGGSTAPGTWGGVAAITTPIVIPENFQTREVGAVLSVDAVYISPAGFIPPKVAGLTVRPTSNKAANTDLMLAAAAGETETVRRLLGRAPAVNAQNAYGSTALMGAAAGGFDDIVAMLIAAKAAVDTKSRSGATALMFAARNGHLEVARRLLEAGADVRALDREDRSALMYASAGGHTPVARLLLERGADPAARSRSGQTPVSLASARHQQDLLVLLTRAGKPSAGPAR